MELDTLSNIKKIAAKIKIKDPTRRLEAAKQVNELAKIIIELKRSQDEKSNNLH